MKDEKVTPKYRKIEFIKRRFLPDELIQKAIDLGIENANDTVAVKTKAGWKEVELEKVTDIQAFMKKLDEEDGLDLTLDEKEAKLVQNEEEE